MHPSRNLIWTRSLLKVGFYLFHWDPNAVKVESYLKQSQKCTKNLFSLFPLFSLIFLLYPVFHESHAVYLCTTMACEVEDYAVLFSTKRASLAQSLSEYFTHICTHVLGLTITGRNYMYLGVGIMICISG